MDLEREADGLPKTGDDLLIKMWRQYAVSLESMALRGVDTSTVARRLGYLEREMERRNIRHDDPCGDVPGSDQKTWHRP